ILAAALMLLSARSLLAQEKPLADVEIPALIDKLIAVTDLDVLEACSRSESSGGSFLPLSPREDERRFELLGPPVQGTEIVGELVSRGATSIPHVVAHLDDRRLTRMRLIIEFTFRGGSSYGEASHLDRNRRTDPPFPNVVNPNAAARSASSG